MIKCKKEKEPKVEKWGRKKRNERKKNGRKKQYEK